MQGVHPGVKHAEHPLDLVVDPLVQRDPHHTGVSSGGLHLGRGQRLAVCQCDPGGKADPHRVGQRGIQRNKVLLGHMAARRKDVMRQRAVIRQQHKASAGFVQPPGRE